MKIKQFEDKNLAHYSYAILNENDQQLILIDPSRNPQPYYDYAKTQDAKIVGVIETHPHADFVSSHLEIYKNTGVKIYAHSLTDADYPFEAFDEGSEINLGSIKLKSLHTPGHSPDSISIVLNHNGKDRAVFTGDTLFIGDCGRPDLREGNGNLKTKRHALAKQMYHSLRDKLMILDHEVIVYPAHGAGTLCGKALSDANKSTIEEEKAANWSLQRISEEEFITELTTDQPFIPKYFAYNVDLNRKGAASFEHAIAEVQIIEKPSSETLNPALVIIDTRPADIFKKGHLPNSYNIQEGAKFETWLGSIISPEEKFYLTASTKEQLNQLIKRTASIGYEAFIEAAFIAVSGEEKMDLIDVEKFRNNPNQYNIIDIRNQAEFESEPIFDKAKNIPLGELRERIEEIPQDKALVIHCAGGYRSAAGSSIVNEAMGGKIKVYDLGEAIQTFSKH